MSDIAALIGDLSTQVKIGWMISFAWGVVLVGWYRHARVAATVALFTPPVPFMPTPADMTSDPTEERRTYPDPTEFPAVQQ